MYMFHAYLGPMRYINMHKDVFHVIYVKGEVYLNTHFYVFPYKKSILIIQIIQIFIGFQNMFKFLFI